MTATNNLPLIVSPRMQQHLTYSVLRVIQADLGDEQLRDFVAKLKMIEEVLSDANGGTALEEFEGLVRDYLRGIFQRVAEKEKQ